MTTEASYVILPVNEQGQREVIGIESLPTEGDTEWDELFPSLNTTNWIERLNRDFRQVLRMRSAIPGEQSVITFIGNVAMDKQAYHRKLPRIRLGIRLFPNPDKAFKADYEP